MQINTPIEIHTLNKSTMKSLNSFSKNNFKFKDQRIHLFQDFFTNFTFYDSNVRAKETTK